MKDKDDFDKLKWIRVFTPMHIPKYLVEQIKNRDYSVEDFYEYQERNCLINNGKEFTLNPLNYLYVLVDEENITKGFTWLSIEPFCKDLLIHIYSIDKEYWNKGKAMSKIAEFVKDFRKKAKLNKIYWITNYPKHSEHYGFKRSKSVLMEYTEESDG